ncbi:MAG: SpoIIE family protein phosphatase [Treponema sp.]|nr:SpoIIE family protein phosphatase [Treponema sp.]
MVIYSIRTKILVIVLVFLSLIGTAFIFYSLATTVSYKRLRIESIQKTLEFETEKVNKVIAELERGSVFYSIGGQLCFEEQSETLGEKFAVEGLSGLPDAVGGGFWFEPYAFKSDKQRAGFYAFYDKTMETVRIDDTFVMDQYDYHNRGWYREIIDNITEPYQVFWTKPYVDDSGSFSLMTTAGSGIYSNERLIAVTTVDWEIDEVISQLIEINPTENSFVLLCVPEKDYIISSIYTDSFIGDSIQSIPWDINSDYFTHNGINYMRFGRYMNNGWLLSIQIPENEIFADVEKQNRLFSVIIEISFVAMLLLAYLLISRFINTPLKHLTYDVAQLGLGNLDMKLKVDSKDELGQLAKTFNKMTIDLKKSIEENARDREEKKRISTELAVAKEIQASMLPSTFPAFPERNEFDIYATMIPAKEIGGDFYDFYFIDKDNLVVVIADVSGKGIPASLFMVNTKTLINNFSTGKSPKEALESVNNKLCENNDSCIFVTAFMGIYNIPTGKFTFVNAGHNPPLLKKHKGNFEYLNTKQYIVLAIEKDTVYNEEEIYLEEGDTLYLYTDGITEAMNKKKELFGEDRLKETLNTGKFSSPKDILINVKREVDNFADGAEQADDITMLSLQIKNIKKDSEEIEENTEIETVDSMKKITVEASANNLQKVMEFIKSELVDYNFPFGLRHEIEIAVEEVFTNIAYYAYGKEGGKTTVAISNNDKTVIMFEDTGRPFNPLEQPPPDLEKPLTDREIGGLGVYMIRNMMDKVEYSRISGKNILKITKNHP